MQTENQHNYLTDTKLMRNFIHKAKNKNLHGCYILAPQANIKNESEDTPFNWLNCLLTSIFDDSSEKIWDAPDIFILDGAKKNLLPDLEELFQYLNFAPLKWPYKFIVIKRPEALSTLIQNKLLKTLEEPPAYCCFFLLKAGQQKLLSTIQSRCIELAIPNNIEATSLSQNFSGKNLEIYNYIKENKLQFGARTMIEELWAQGITENDLLHFVLDFLVSENNKELANGSYQELTEIFSFLQKQQTATLFHNNPNHRCFSLMQLIYRFVH